MTKDTSIPFDEAAERHGRHPRFILNFTRLGEEFISWSDGIRWDIIKNVPSWTGTIKPDKGSSDISGVTIAVIDDTRFHQFANLINNDEPVQLLGGFENIFETDFAVLITGLVEDFYEGPLGEWRLKVNDLRYYEVKSIFRSFGKSRLNGAINDVVAIIDVDSTDAAATGDQAFKDPASSVDTVTVALLIDNEIIVPAGKNATQFTGCARGEYSAVGGSDPAAHSDNATVRELFIIEDNPIDIILKMLCSTGTGTNGAYDVWDSDQGMAVDEALVDIDKFEQERDRYIPTDTYRFPLKETIKDFKSWVEKQLYLTMNAYPVTTGAGQISMVLYHMPFDAAPDDMTADDVIQISQWNRGLRDLVNNTHILWDKSITDGEYKSQRFDLHAPSINDHGLSKTWKLSADGLCSDLQADSIIGRRINRLFGRYADGPVRFKAKVDFSKFRWDPGDLIEVTLDAVLDIARGVRGVVGDLMEVVSWRPDPNQGTIDVEMLDSRLEGKGAMITPDGWPTYSAADDDESTWGYICESATEKMANGDPPSLIV